MTAPLLVTGAAGFIGSRFVASCGARQIPVISVDNPTYFVERREHAPIDFGTIVDRQQLFDWLATERPTLAGIVHLGACTDTTELDLAYLRETNLEYSQRLWQFATAHHLPMVYASSAATYGDGSLGYDDDEALLPRLHALNPYGDSKQRFDLWALDEERAARRPPQWCGYKFFNVYGFGERHKQRMASVVLQAFDQIRAGSAVKLFKSARPDFADGHQLRDFIYVDDVVRALHYALNAPIARGIFNLGTGAARTFLDLARATFAALDLPEHIEFIEMPADLSGRYQYRTEARMDRLRAAGFTTPFTTLEDGVRAYVSELLKAS